MQRKHKELKSVEAGGGRIHFGDAESEIQILSE